ncbi:MAG: GGDEF domain-containing protein [Gemmatimonadaceae bacterium]|nr:GGDEF domain-containing protein [Gemmatimonadaceae bacterium]
MFFKKLISEPSPSSERSSSHSASGSPQFNVIAGGAGQATAEAPRASNDQSDVGLGLVLDALGGVLTALARYPLDLPDRPADESAQAIAKWQRHATMGSPLEDAEEATSVGVIERDWNGVVRAITDQRREEHRHVTGSINELRDALWSCVETVHNAVKVDQQTDVTTNDQMDKARNALKRLQPGSIKQEVLGAVTAIEGALQARREQQADQYTSLAVKLDRLGKQLEEARKESTTDALTGLGNRKMFDTMVARAIQMFSMARQPVVLLMIDMDKLKLVNDMYGHQAGDTAIATLGVALSKVFLRQSDVLCRYGGDEFAAILHNTDWKMAQTLARRLQDTLSQLPAPHPAMEFSIGASVGVAQLEPLEEVEEWKARADKALYKAKQSGRDRVAIAESPSVKVA